MMLKRSLLDLTIFLGFSCLAGCLPSKKETPVGDPCALVTKEEIEGLVHREVPKPASETYGGDSGRALVSTCTFRIGSGTVSEEGEDSGYQIALLVRREAYGFDNSSSFDVSAKVKSAVATPISGIGERAYVAEGEIHVLRGDITLIVAIKGASADVGSDTAEKIARIALGRLPPLEGSAAKENPVATSAVKPSAESPSRAGTPGA